jgi:hypothetical protein
MDLNHGNIRDATACFAEKFEFNDRGIGLEFKDKERLAEFFQKARELYPDSSLQTDRILVSGDYVRKSYEATARQGTRSRMGVVRTNARRSAVTSAAVVSPE